MRELEREAPEAAGATADTKPLPRLVIVGRGRVGDSMARAAERAGLDVLAPLRDGIRPACVSGEAALLCVPDSAIADACAAIAEAVPPLRFVGHVSGATGLGALDAAAARGAETFSVHPLQTVPARNTDLTGAPSAIAGSTAAARAFATNLAQRLGLRPFEISEEHRAVYHAAASMASNFLIALQESAAGLLDSIGADDARELLAPLVLRTAANWAEAGPAALTGPIARGDTATIDRHLEALRASAPELVALYEALAERTRAIARADGPPDGRRA